MGGSTTVQAPAPVNPAQVGADSLAAQIQLAPQQYAAEAQYRPQYAALNAQIARDQLPGVLDLYSQSAAGMGAMQGTANTTQRTADIADVSRLGGQAVQAFQAANPKLTNSMAGLEARIAAARNVTPGQISVAPASAGPLGSAAQAYAGSLAPAATINPTFASAGRLGPALGYAVQGAQASALTPRLMGDAQNYAQPSELQQALAAQARAQLTTGGNLTGQELQKVQQDTRAAYAARGLYDSNQAMGAEILQTDAARRQRQAENQAFAQQVDASTQAQLQVGRSFALGVEDSAAQRAQFNAGAQNQAGQFAAGAQNQYGLTQYGTQAQLSLANAAAANQAAALNAGAQNQFALTQYGTAADLARTNAAAQNQFALTQYGTQADLARSNSALGLQGQMANAEVQRAAQNDQYGREITLANMYQGQATDPYQLVLGRSGAVQQGMGAGQTAQGYSSAGAQMFDPFNSSIMDIYSGNQASQLAASTATANNNASMIGGGLSAIGSIAGGALAGKIFFACLPEGQAVDTPAGPVPVQDLHPGDLVIGYEGAPVRVLQKHEYAEDPEGLRFRRITLESGASFELCDRHRVKLVPAGRLRVGDEIAGQRLKTITPFGGVSRSYDLLTEDPGYRLAGVPVNSMIEEMAAFVAARSKL